MLTVLCLGASAYGQVASNDNCGSATNIADGIYHGDTSNATNDGTASCGNSSTSADVWFAYTADEPCFLFADTCCSGYDTVLSIHTFCSDPGGSEQACNDDYDCDGDGDVGNDGFVSAVALPLEGGDTYLIRIAGFEGATGPFTLDVSCHPPIEADNCSDAVEVSEGVYFGDTTAASNDGSASCGESNSVPDVWYLHEATEECLLRVDTCGSSYDTVLSLHDGCPGGEENELDCNDDACAVQSTVVTAVEPGQWTFIRVSGWQGATGQFRLDVSCDPQGEGADILIGELTTFQQFGRLGSVVGCAVDSPVCNAGTEPLDWFPLNNPHHPFMIFNMYRLMDDRIQHIGQSWVKHGFASTQADTCGLGCCPWHDSTRTGIGCSDTYSAGTNAVQGYLGPRYEINPWSGEWVYEGSHLELNKGEHDPIEHRLQLRDDDLDPAQNPDAVYYCELYVLSHDDADHMNSIAWEPVVVSGAPGGTWSFNIGGPDTQIGPALDAWAGAMQTVIPDAPERDGRVILAVKVSPGEGGTTHYEYALHNHDLDRAIGSFSVPMGSCTTVSNVGFAAVPSHDEPFSNSPWQATRTADALIWETVPFDGDALDSNPLRWGTLFNFWFDADAEPADTTVSLGLFYPGSPAELTGATTGPAFHSLPGDLDGNGVIDAADLAILLGSWGPCPNCPADFDGDGDVDAADLAQVLGAWGLCP